MFTETKVPFDEPPRAAHLRGELLGVDVAEAHNVGVFEQPFAVWVPLEAAAGDGDAVAVSGVSVARRPLGVGLAVCAGSVAA